MPRKTYEKAKTLLEDFKEITQDSESENYLYKIFMLKRLMDSIEVLCLEQVEKSQRNSSSAPAFRNSIQEFSLQFDDPRSKLLQMSGNFGRVSLETAASTLSPQLGSALNRPDMGDYVDQVDLFMRYKEAKEECEALLLKFETNQRT